MTKIFPVYMFYVTIFVIQKYNYFYDFQLPLNSDRKSG